VVRNRERRRLLDARLRRHDNDADIEKSGSLPITLVPVERKVRKMADNEALAEINRRIAIVQDNLRELIEQAAAFSGAEDEERNADRIADQEAKLAELEKQRDALLGKK
jgi:hypothetical protein